MNLEKTRNIGISAHIDSGKTTLTERILFYCNKIHKISEVRGKDGVGAKMDSMELEKERGITIASAATYVNWGKTDINIIDTPGHVDFTVEVENALRVLDGAVLVLCGVGGVQSQSFTVDRQLSRNNVPNLAFINKLDRTGANPFKVTQMLCEKLGRNAVMMQIPIGKEDGFQGVVDLVEMKAIYFDGDNGESLRYEEVAGDLKDQADEYREKMLDELSMIDDELAEAILEGKESSELIKKVVRIGVIANQITPVFMGSAFKNKGVQPLLDAIDAYLPNPTEIDNEGFDADNDDAPVIMSMKDTDPAVAYAFKLENQQYGQLTYIRLYQGAIKKGDELVNNRTRKKVKIGRLAKMHSDEMVELAELKAGDIGAIFGVDCALGDTFTEPSIHYHLRSSHIPEPIISLSIKPKDNNSQTNMAKALNRFTKEDLTFKSYLDEETSETIIQGIGELHLDVYIERMRREYKVDLEVGKPQVAYRETITKEIPFEYIHKKQSGGRGQYAKIMGILSPSGSDDNEFETDIKGGSIPSNYFPGCEKGFDAMMAEGYHTGFPAVGIKMIINDGDFHPVDSSQLAFELATKACIRENYRKAVPAILEPMMKVSIDVPAEFRGAVLTSINQRRGTVLETRDEEHLAIVSGEIPLSEIFGYGTALRSNTQGKAELSIEFDRYERVPRNLEEDILAEIQKAREERKK